MIFFTGDIHGAVDGIAEFITKVHPTMEDVIVLLGDVGANYYNGRKDYLMKQWLNDSGTRFLCIHGNHEMRPVNISGYIETEARDGCSQNIRTWSLPRTVRSIR